ncbi:hypothetical protein O6H91_04G092100 [Diphasiastrum complanatum]|uniref:Uncharacterized protein n=1 Tax=Diphasiastrum complanatum TaxID=34168 RepID=A0ACC2DZF9_DIPCM|nr:hypothetical protein O6H91_04G092100 [Diphasiastrum complanatum]
MDTGSLAPENRRKLLLGEFVEVRQKEKGLRGSWHPGVIVKVWLGRRSVEYNELLSKDGIHRLRECIPVPIGVEGAILNSQHISRLPALKERGLIRPRPPPCTEMPRKSWRKGIWMDAFYNDAWWEGILMEDVLQTTDDSQVRVFFPDEGDEAQIPLTELRVLQEWDDTTSFWSIKGYTLPGLTGEESLLTSEPHSEVKESEGCGSSLRTRSTLGSQFHAEQHNSQKVSIPSRSSYMSGATAGMVDRKENQTNCTSILKKTSSPLLESSAYEFVEKEETLADWIKTAKQKALEGKVLATDHYTFSDDVAMGGINMNQGSARKTTADTEKAANNQETCMKGVHSNIEGKKNDSKRKRFDPQNGKARKWHLDKSCSNYPTSRDIIREANNRARQTLQEAGWKIHLGPHNGKRRISHYRSPEGGRYISLHAACTEWIRLHGSGIDSKSLGRNGILQILNGYILPNDRDLLQEANNRANQTLEEAGWKVCPRLRNGKMKVAYYMSPNGVRYYSLFAACTEWKRVHGSGIDSKLLEENGVLQILSVHKFMQEEPCNSKKKVLKVSHKPVTLTRSRFLRSSSKIHESSQTGISSPLLYRQNVTGSLETLIHQKKTRPGKLSLTSKGDHVESSFKRKRSWQHSYESTEPRSRIRKSSKRVKIMPCRNVTERRSRKRKHNVLEETPTEIVKVKRRRRASEITKAMQSFNRSYARSGRRRGLEVLLSAPGRGRAEDGSVVGISKRTIISWLIDMGVIAENEKVRYLSRKDKHVMMEGQVTRDGVLCECCKMVLTLSSFEAHAGSKLHRPCANIFLADGRSLSECQMQALKIKDETMSPSKAIGEANRGDCDGSDDTCGVCGDGGKLICCDHCPSTFHLNCVQVENVPEGDWYCPHCRCAVCGGSQFTNRDSFDEMSVLYCDQCAHEYHVTCLNARGMPKMDKCPENIWFCGNACDKIFEGLRGLVGITNALEDGFSWTLLRSVEDDRLSTTENSLEVIAEHNSKLALALSVMQECFRPMIDPRTQIEMISHILYNRGSELKRLNFGRFYTLILERGDELISVASIRVHGARLAEMPLIGTRFQYRRQGMCRRLMNALEKMLQNLKVEILVLPAVPELLETWTNAFGFQSMVSSERLEFVNSSIVAFPGTTLLRKSLSNLPSARHYSDVPCNGLQALPTHCNTYEGKRKRGRPAKRHRKNHVAVITKRIFGDKQVSGIESEAYVNVQAETLESSKGVVMPTYNQGRIFETKDDLDVKLSSQNGNLDGPSFAAENLNVFSVAPEKVNHQIFEVMEKGNSKQEPKLSEDNHGSNNQEEKGISRGKNKDDLNLGRKLSHGLVKLSCQLAGGVLEMPVDSVKRDTEMHFDLSMSPIQDQYLYNKTRATRHRDKQSKIQLNKTGGQGCEGVPDGNLLSKNSENSELPNNDVSTAIHSSASNSITCRVTDVPTSLHYSSQDTVLGEQACLTGMKTLRSGRMLLRSSLNGSETVSSENELRAVSRTNGSVMLRLKIGGKPLRQRSNGKKLQKQKGLVDSILGQTERASLSKFEECKHQDTETATCQPLLLQKLKAATVTPLCPFPISTSTDFMMAMEITQTGTGTPEGNPPSSLSPNEHPLLVPL